MTGPTCASSVSVARGSLQVDNELFRFVCDELVPGSGLTSDEFWSSLAVLVDRFAIDIVQHLRTRASMQHAIDEWHRSHPDGDSALYRQLLNEIGYLAPPGEAFTITTPDVDPEVAETAGPQLVVPASNARYALNAANARWGSLYDALYGTDVLGDRPTNDTYDAARGRRVIAWVRDWLDVVVPLANGSHGDAERYTIIDGAVVAEIGGVAVPLQEVSHFVGYQGRPERPSSVLFRHHGLHVDIRIDSTHPIGRTDRAGVCDVVLESAVTTIVDFEDSVAAVDAADKVAAYRNWLGLMQRNLEADIGDANDSVRIRRLNEPRRYETASGPLELPGCALMFVRNVGHHMFTDAIRGHDGEAVPETIVDVAVSVVAAMHDRSRTHGARNSSTGSIYIVKPKLHGPQEAELVEQLFAEVENQFGLPPFTVKVGLMDEERRTTVNLPQCIGQLRHRIVFVNTGFLDRTGDEIRTDMFAGPVVRKNDMKREAWLSAYENWNVDVALGCGFAGRAQIGKGMWAATDLMRSMLEQKITHPRAGASCAWVPSPTAATLHALQYHEVDVAGVQSARTPGANFDDLLRMPIANAGQWTPAEVDEELENNVQGILGYVVRWVDSGIGCSKVPDTHNVNLMEDRATCRISSQHIANWLHHGVVLRDQVERCLRKMAAIVDAQNRDTPDYQPMAPRYDGLAFRAASRLIFEGIERASGYTETVLHEHRRLAKGTRRVLTTQ